MSEGRFVPPPALFLFFCHHPLRLRREPGDDYDADNAPLRVSEGLRDMRSPFL